MTWFLNPQTSKNTIPNVSTMETIQLNSVAKCKQTV